MIPKDAQDWIFPQIADGNENAVVLCHVCGVDIQFYVDSGDGKPYVVSEKHLRSWNLQLDTLAQTAGMNCFQYNTLSADPDGVFHDNDRNTLSILLSPATYIEHNSVDGDPLLLVISESDCILTGTKSVVGNELISQYLPRSLAKRVVTIDSKWDNWIIDGVE